MERSTDTKTGYDDLEVYIEYGYVFVSSTGSNDVKMAAFSFNHISQPPKYLIIIVNRFRYIKECYHR